MRLMRHLAPLRSLGALFVLLGSAVPALAQAPAGLFVDAASPASADMRADQSVTRFRHVTVDAAQIRPAGRNAPTPRRITLNLFPGLSWTAELDRLDTTATGTVWNGHIPGVPSSAVTLSMVNGAMHGSVFTPDGTYIVRPVAGAVHAITEVDQGRFPQEADPVEAQVPARAFQQPDAAMADTSGFIDVMVLYTPAAQSAAGGSAAVTALINAAISNTNSSYANSGVAQRLRLAYAGPVSYTETGGSTGISTDLHNLTNGSGNLSGVAALRNTYHADLVSLFTNTPGTVYCGIAWLMTSVSSWFEANGFSVVEQSCAVGNMTFAHELGHNMGAGHDWYVDAGTAPYTYSHGYVNTSARWRTIMAYNNICSAQGFNCSRLPYWSNPSQTYGGAPMGVPGGTNSSASCYNNTSNPACDADDQRTLDNTASVVANFRQSTVSVTSLTPSVTMPVAAGTTVTWTATASGGTTPYTYKFWIYDGVAWTVGQDWSSASTFAWTPATGGSYTLQAWVRNAGSVATYDAWLGATATVTSSTPLSVSSVLASPSSGVVGTPVTWTATATGGTAPYSYKFYVTSGAGWTVGRDWNSSNSWTWAPASPGSYTVQVWARNSGSVATYDAWANASPVTMTASPASITGLSASPSFPVAAGTPMTLTATATGGTAPYTYKLFAYNGSAWTVVQDWTTSNTFSWTPSTAGTYTFQVWLRNAGSVATYDTWRAFGPYQVSGAGVPTVTALVSSHAFPLAAGTPVQWTATATGGSAPYTYKFYVYNGSTWTVGQDWGPSNSWTWTPPAAGSYTVQVWVRNAGSSATWDAWKGVGPLSVVP